MLFKQDIQTGMLVFLLTVSIQEQVKRSVDGWSYFIEEQDQLLQASSEWSQRTRSRTQDQGIKVICRLMIKDEDQRETFCLEEITRVCIFYFVFIGPCVQFLPSVLTWITSTKKRFLWKKLDTLSQDQGLRSVYQLFLHKNT